MLTQITDRIPPLSVLIPVLLTAWAGACTVLHGPAILAYIAIQASTSGIFALSMYRISRKYSRNDSQSIGVAATPSPSAQKNDQPVTA